MSVVALSELLGAAVRDASGAVRGRVREIAIAPQDHPTRIAFLIVRTPDGERMLPAAACTPAAPPCAPPATPAGWEPFTGSDGVLLLKRDLLDQQIIDVHGRKVVRVNDVELDSTPVNSHVVARRRRRGRRRARRDPPARQGRRAVVHAAGAAREDSAARHPVAVRRSARDRPGAPGQAEDRLRRPVARCTRPTSPTSSRTCRPPSAKRCSRRSTKRSPPKRSRRSIPDIQVSIVESLDSDRAADIVEEMDPDAAADLLGDLHRGPVGRDPQGDAAGGAAGGHAAPRVRRAHRRRPHDDRVHRGSRNRRSSTTRSRRCRQFEGSREAVATIYLTGAGQQAGRRRAAREDRHLLAGRPAARSSSEPYIACAPDTPRTRSRRCSTNTT